MKGLAPIVLLSILGVALILIVSGIGLIPENLVVSGELVDGCKFVEPQFGRMECEPISSYTKVREGTLYDKDFNEHDYRITCGDNENSPECEFSVSCDPGSMYFEFQYSESGICPIDTDKDAKWCRSTVYSGSSTIPNVVFEAHAPVGSQVRIRGCYYQAPLDMWRDWYGGNVYSGFIPYGLNVYDSGGKYRYNTQSCNLGDLSWVDRYKVCTESDGTACQKIKTSDRLNFNDWVNYLSSWQYAPIDLTRKIVEYNGRTAYCHVNKVYDIGHFETADECYTYPRSVIASVDCCPGMETANSVCGDDFQWHPINIGECQSDQDCYTKYGKLYTCEDHNCHRTRDCITDFECTGQGEWVPDYSSPTNPRITRETCQNYKCVPEYKSVQCIPPNVNCPSGQVCNPNKGYICESQVGPVVCGDGICSTPYEDHTNCPADCEPPPTRDWLKLIIGGLIFGLALALALLVITIFIPVFKPLHGWLRQPKNFALLAGIFTIIGIVVFAGLVSAIGAEMVAGAII